MESDLSLVRLVMSFPINLLRNTAYTLRYIPPFQLAALVKHRLGSLFHLLGNPWPKRIGRLAEKEWPETGIRSLRLAPLSTTSPHADLLSQWRLFKQGKLTLLNREEVFSPGSFWEHTDEPNLPSLVVETLHYHQFIAGMGELLAQPGTGEAPHAEILSCLGGLIDEWWARYPVGQLPAWGSFAVSFRVRSWLWLHRLLSQCPELQARTLEETIERRAFFHGLYLERNLERHLGGNHLFKDLCAMAMLASFYEGPTASRWFALIESSLKHELRVQILPDGGHYERSPMYQCLVLSDLLDAAVYLMGWNPFWVAENLVDPIQRMSTFLAGILHPDGEIPLFNDSVLGQSAPAHLVLSRAEEMLSLDVQGVVEPLTTFPSAGFTRLRQGLLTCILDHGRLGPDELMGHVHNDTLSLELSVGDERFIVDKGVYEYTAGPRRTECRSIRSHNTPSAEGFEQAETWASFRVARRWHIKDSVAVDDSQGTFVEGEWERPGMEWIGRRVATGTAGSLVIRDEIRCHQTRACQIPFLFAPGIKVTVFSSGGDAQWWRWEARSGVHVLCGWIHSTSPLQVTVENTVSWPRFYTELGSSRMVTRSEVQAHIVVFTYLATSWEALKGLPFRDQNHFNESGTL